MYFVKPSKMAAFRWRENKGSKSVCLKLQPLPNKGGKLIKDCETIICLIFNSIIEICRPWFQPSSPFLPNSSPINPKTIRGMSGKNFCNSYFSAPRGGFIITVCIFSVSIFIKHCHRNRQSRHRHRQKPWQFLLLCTPRWFYHHCLQFLALQVL